MSKTRVLLSFAAVSAFVGSFVLAQPPAAFDTMEKMKMSWTLAYNLKPGEATKYEIDTIASQRVANYNVAEAGSEEEQKSSSTSRVYFTQKVVDVDEQKVPSLEFTYDNVVMKQTVDGQEQALDTAEMAGRKFTVRVSPKGKIIDVEGSGNTAEFQSILEALFINYPDKTLKIGDEWEDKRESESVDAGSGLKIEQTTGIKYRVKDFEEFQRRDTIVILVFMDIDQQLSVLVDDAGGTVVRTEGQGTGKGSSKGTIRVDSKTGELVTSELSFQLRNSMTIDEHQLVGATIRTKYTTEFSSTTTTRLQ